MLTDKQCNSDIMEFLPVLLFWFELVHLGVPYCSDDTDCNDDNFIRCGYCQIRDCNFFMSSEGVYLNSTACDFKLDNCYPESCRKETTVDFFEGYGGCVCVCRKGYFNTKCQNPGGRFMNYPVGLQFIYPTSVKVNEPEPGFILVQKGGASRFDFIVYDETYGSMLLFLNSPSYINPDKPLDVCLERAADVKPCEFFKSGLTRIYIFDLDLPLTYTRRNEDIGYGYEVKLMTYLFDSFFDPAIRLRLVNGWSRTVHVEVPKDYTAVPIIRLINCGGYWGGQIIYKVHDSFQLMSQINFIVNFNLKPNPDLQKSLTVVWESVRVVKEFLGFTKDEHVTYSMIGKTSWNVEKRSWEPGMYIVRLTASLVEKKTRNFKQCFIEIKSVPLQAVIVGGSARSVRVEDVVILDATGSANPNVPVYKENLLFTISCNWTEEVVCQPYITKSKSYEAYKIGPDILHVGQVYEFTLKVESLSYQADPAFAKQLITVVQLKNKTGLSIEIECIYNCEAKMNSQDITYLRVKGHWKKLRNFIFEWLSVRPNGEEKSVENMRADTPSYIMLVKGGKLAEDKDYNFKAKVKDGGLFAIFSFMTSGPSNTTCLADPTSGIKGVTSFNISCVAGRSESDDSDVHYTYEFYDKQETDSDGFSGRMLSRQRTREMSNVLLTRGKVEILTFDETGMATVIKLDVTLSESNMTAEDIEKMMIDTVKLARMEDVSNFLRRATVVSEILKPEMNRDDILEMLLEAIARVRLDTFDETKICISTLYNILDTIYRRENYSLSLLGAFHASHALQSIGEALGSTMPLDSQCTFNTMYQIFRTVLDCIYLVLEVKNKETKTEPYEYANPAVYSQIKGISTNVMDCLSNMAYILLLRHFPSQPHEQIVSNIGNLTMWVKVDIAEAISNFTLDQNFPIIISRKMANLAEDMHKYIGLQYTSFMENAMSLKKVNTNSYDVYVCYKSDDGQCDYPRSLKYPIGLAFNTTDIISEIEHKSASVNQLDLSLPPDQLDLDLTVYRLDIKPMTSVHIEFQFESDFKEIKVLIEKRRRPDYEMVIKQGSIVSASNPGYRVTYEHGEEPEFFYMAILPASSVPKDSVVTFKFKSYSKVCYSWHGQWEKEGCQVKEDPNQNRLICECSRMSLFSALVEDQPVTLDAVQDFPLLFTEFSSLHNQLTLLALLLLVIMMVALFAAWIDRRNRVKRFAVVLKDNYPGERYGYLICVNTGARIAAGTDAPIGIRMYGDTNDSRPHILASDLHDVMEGLGEDWFVIYTPELLGDIECVDIWHDNTGTSPDWFCDSVLIYDLTRMRCFFFLVNEWLTLDFKKVPQVFVFPTTLKELAAGPRMFLDNLKSGFVLSHIWMSTIVRHPRDPVTRVDRLAVIFCFILVVMTTSIALIKLTDAYIEIDDPTYAVTWREIFFSLISLGVGAAAVYILTEMFRKVYKIIFFRKHETGDVENVHSFITYKRISRDNIDPTLTFLQYGHRHLAQKTETSFWDKINLRLMPPPLIPVQLQGDEPNCYIRLVWCAITWLTVMIIVVACLILCVIWSQKLPRVKTKKWLTIVIFAVIEHTFILLPTKIILTSLVLALVFKRIVYKDIYTFKPEDGRQMELFGDRKHLFKVIKHRYHPMYLPLHECLKEEHRQHSLRIEKWRNLFHLLQMLALLVVLSGVLTTNSFVYYHSNAHLRSLLMDSQSTSRLDYCSIMNESDFYMFLEHSLHKSLFDFAWYNLDSLNTGVERGFFRRDWLYDGTYRMLGRVRSRQLRVAPGSCEAPAWARNATRDLGCAAPWRWWNEDKMEYGELWFNPKTNPNHTQETSSLYALGILDHSNRWGYTEAADDPCFDFYGETGNIYHPGGYVIDLGSSGEELEMEAKEIDEKWWLGHFTRAVLTQISAYNVNTECFTEVVLVMEQTISGEYIPTIMVLSVVTSFRVQVWLVLFILFTIQFCLRLYMMMSYSGILGFFSRPSRIFEMVLFILSVASLILLLIHYLSSPGYVADYLRAAKNDDFYFYKIAYYFFTARVLMGFVFILALLRFYSLFRFGRFFSACFYTFMTSLRITLWVMLGLLLSIAVVWRFIGYLLSSFIEVVFRPNLFYKTNFLYLSNSDQLLFHKIITFLVCFGSAVVIGLFVCIFTYQYKYLRRYYMGDWTKVNLMLFLIEEVKSIGFDKAHQVKHLEEKLVSDYSRRKTKNSSEKPSFN